MIRGPILKLIVRVGGVGLGMLFLLLSVVTTVLANTRGFPLFFGSFEDVGQGEVLKDVLSVKEVDNKITKWTKGCPADVYVLINDHSAFDLRGLKRVQRAAENSLTRGSFLTDEVVDLHELALDLHEYCDAALIRVDAGASEEVAGFSDTKTRVFYVDIPAGLPEESKDAVLTQLMGVVPSPYVTVCYASHVQQSQPVLRSVKESKQRSNWNSQRHSKDNIRPIIAPLFDKKNTGHAAPEPTVELPDNFFVTLAVGSVLFAVFLAYRDLTAKPRSPKSRTIDDSKITEKSKSAASGNTVAPSQSVKTR